MSVLVIGDSHVGGLAPRLKQLLPGVVTSFVNSTHTAQWTGFNPGGDRIVVVLGTNDISKRRPASETANAARQIVARAGRPVLWALPPQYNRGGATLDSIRSSGAQIIESLNLPLRDGWHPTAQGYQTWADAIAQQVSVGGQEAPAPAAAIAELGESPGSSSLLIYLLLGLILVKVVRE